MSGLRLQSLYDHVFTFYDAIHKMKIENKISHVCLLSNNLYGYWSESIYNNYTSVLICDCSCLLLWLHFLKYNYVCVNKPVYRPCRVHLVTAPLFLITAFGRLCRKLGTFGSYFFIASHWALASR